MWFISLSILFILLSLIPLIQNTHWFFTFFEFAKIQLFGILTFITVLGFFLITNKNTFFYVVFISNLATLLYQLIALFPFTKWYPTKQTKAKGYSSKTIILISANVYQENKETDKLIEIITQQQPDLFLTMESNQKWENALAVMEQSYPYHVKVPQENTYGMHLYSKLEILSHHVHYFVADDIPCIEALLKTSDGYVFNFFGVHPPPPSPTEEKNSKERDGELLSLAKVIKTKTEPCVVAGDFNNVAWAKSSILFRKTSELIDARIGRGLFSTFHAKYWFFRFPIDLFFHSPKILIEKLKTLAYFGSDHFPIYSSFCIAQSDSEKNELVETLETENEEEVEEIIEEGKKEKSENR